LISLTGYRLHDGELGLKAADAGIALENTPGLREHTPLVKALLHNARALALARLDPQGSLKEVRRELEMAAHMLPEYASAANVFSVRSNLASVLDVMGELEAGLEVLPVRPPSSKPDPPPDGPIRSDARNGEEVSPPIKLSTPHPQYSNVAQAWGLHGVVQLETVIGRDGQPRRVRVLQGIPGLNVLAIRAVEEWTFEPAAQNGTPVEALYNLTINFRLP
jgi:TonB family protein